MQFSNTSLRQRGQRSATLNDYNFVALRATTDHGTHSAVNSTWRRNFSKLPTIYMYERRPQKIRFGIVSEICNQKRNA